MYEYSSRSEERQEKFYLNAQKKEFDTEEILYPSEVTRLQKNGFTVEKIRDFNTSKSLGVYTVSWANPFPNGIPHIVYSYCTGILNIYPKNKISNFAQELYVIAHKA